MRKARSSGVLESRNQDSIMSLLACPITKEVFREPCTLVADGWTYEKEALISWFQFGYDISPTTGENLHGITAFTDSKLISKVRSNYAELPPVNPKKLKRMVWELYEKLTSSFHGSKLQRATESGELRMPIRKPTVSTPNFYIPPNVSKPVSANHLAPPTRQSSNLALPKASYSPRTNPHSFSRTPQPMKSSQLHFPSCKRNSSDPTYRCYFDRYSSNQSLEMISTDYCEKKREMPEEKLLKKLRKYPQKGTWTMEESTKFWHVRLNDAWQNDYFRKWIVNEVTVTFGSIRNTVYHMLAEEWVDKLNMRSESIGWFTPPFHGDLKVPVYLPLKNPSKEVKKGETVRFNLERLYIRNAKNCRYGPAWGNFPRHLRYQREENGRSSYATAMLSVSVTFVPEDIIPDAPYFCNILYYGVRDALTNCVVNLSKEGGLQLGELHTTRLSQQIRKTSWTYGSGWLVQRGENWFCVLNKRWQAQREHFLTQAKRDFKGTECYVNFCKPYKELSLSNKSGTQRSEDDLMKWEVKGEQFEVALGKLETSRTDIGNTINFKYQYLQHEVVEERLEINARVVFPDLDKIDSDDKQFKFNIAMVVPAFKLNELPSTRVRFE